MSVYFVYRSHYNDPKLNHVKKFDDNTVLEWFQAHWDEGATQYASDEKYVTKLFGCDVYGFSSLFEAINQNELSQPQSFEELEEILADHLYVEGEICFGEGFIQVLTDDDELELAYYFFDDTYLAAQGEKAEFLLQADWRLPANFSSESTKITQPCTAISPGAGGTGTTYCSFLAYYDSINLQELEGPFQINGMRLPNLVRYLAEATPEKEEGKECAWPLELRLLRAALAGHSADSSNVTFEEALETTSKYPIAEIANRVDWSSYGIESLSKAKADFDKIAAAIEANERDAPLLQIEEHFAQACINTETFDGQKLYHRWIFFDDLWAGENLELANAVLCYATRWDVLT